MGIAELYFRLDNDQILHTRVVYRFMDWLGDIGGVYEILRNSFTFILGGYAIFHQQVEIISAFHCTGDDNKCETNDEDESF